MRSDHAGTAHSKTKKAPCVQQRAVGRFDGWERGSRSINLLRRFVRSRPASAPQVNSPVDITYCPLIYCLGLPSSADFVRPRSNYISTYHGHVVRQSTAPNLRPLWPRLIFTCPTSLDQANSSGPWSLIAPAIGPWSLIAPAISLCWIAERSTTITARPAVFTVINKFGDATARYRRRPRRRELDDVNLWQDLLLAGPSDRGRERTRQNFHPCPQRTPRPEAPP